MERIGHQIMRILSMTLVVIMTLQTDVCTAEDADVEMCVLIHGFRHERENWPRFNNTQITSPEEIFTVKLRDYLEEKNQTLAHRLSIGNSYTQTSAKTTSVVFNLCEKFTCTCKLASSFGTQTAVMVEFAIEAISDRGMPMGHWELETEECPFKTTVIDTSSFQSLECTEPANLRNGTYQEYTPGMFYFFNKEASKCVSFCVRWTYTRNPLFNPKSVEFHVVRYVALEVALPRPPNVTYARNSSGTTFFSKYGKFLFNQEYGIVTGALTLLDEFPEYPNTTNLNEKYLELVKAAPDISVPRTIPILSQSCLLFHPEIPPERRYPYNFYVYVDLQYSQYFFDDDSPIVGIGPCVGLEVNALGGVDNEIHVSFRKYPHKSRKTYTECSHYDIKEITLQALTQNVFPTNVLGRSKNTFRLAHATSDSNNCVGEDLTLDQIQSPEIKFLPCVNTPNGDGDWIMKDYPPEIVWMRLNKDSEGACFTWSLGPAIKNLNPGHRDPGGIFVSFTSELLVHEQGKEPYVVHLRADNVMYFIHLFSENQTLLQETGNISQQSCHHDPYLPPITSKYTWLSGDYATVNQQQINFGIDYLLTPFYSVNCAVKDKYAKLDPITGEKIDGCSIPLYQGEFPTYHVPSKGKNNEKHSDSVPESTPKIDAEEESISDQSYELCNIVKACFAPCDPDKDCISGRFCQTLVVLNSPKYLPKKRKQDVIIEILAYGAKRVAIALSQDDNNNLGDDYVIECKQESNGHFNLYTSWRTNTTTYPQPNPATASVRLEVGSSDRVTLYCRFHLKFKFSITPVLPENKTSKKFTYDFNWVKYYMFVVTDETTSPGEKGIQHRTGACTFKDQIDFAHVLAPNDSQKKMLGHHGLILVVVWFILLPIGIFVGRYLKETDVTATVCQIRLFKFIHILLMTLSFALFMWSFVELFFGVIGWNAGDADSVQFHFYGGYLVFLLFLGEMITGCWGAEEIYEEGVDLIRVIHGFFGHSMYILGVFVFMFSSSLRYSGLSCSVNAAVIVWLIFYILLQIPIWLQYLWLDYAYCDGWAGVSTGICMFNRLILSNDYSMDAPGSTLRRRVTFIFSVLSVMFGIIMVVLMNTSTDLCFQEEAKHDIEVPEYNIVATSV